MIERSSFPTYVLECLDQLQQNGFQAYIVGGAIRNLLLGLPVHDYDLTTNALPEQMKQCFAKDRVFDTGIQHGTLTVVKEHHPIEITTYRMDSSYQDHRHPSSVQFASTLKEDCQRRDFTINALCYNPQEGLVDYFDGQQDLEQRCIRCIGNPDHRFQEDALRILRAIRFASQLGFSIEPVTKKSIFDQKDLLSYISVERIHEETDGILNCPQGAQDFFQYLPVFFVYLPELKIFQDHLQKQQQATQAMQRCPDNATIRMAILLHYAFENPQEQTFRDVCNRLKYSNKEKTKLLHFTCFPSLPLETRIDVRKMMQIQGIDSADYLSFRFALDPSLPASLILSTFKQIQKEKDCISMSQLVVHGEDAIRFGFRGNEIHTILESTLNAIVEDRLENRKEVIYEYWKTQQ